MSRTKPKAPPTFWPVAALAQAWGVHEQVALVLLHDHGAELESRMFDGLELRGIPNEGKERIEQTQRGEQEKAERSDKLNSALFLLGMGLHIWTGEDAAYLESHYTARDFMAEDARNVLGIETTGNDKQRTIYRTRETDAEVIREALALFAGSGIYKPRAMREREAAIAAAKATPETPEKKAA